MDKRFFGFGIIFISLLLLAGIVYVFFFYNFKAPAPEESDSTITDQSQEPAIVNTNTAVNTGKTNQTAPRVRKEEMNQEDLKRMAGSFAERFGSYSNQSDYSNIGDLMVFMTSRMEEWAGQYMNEAAKKGGNLNIYYGISTKAVTEEVKSFDKEAGLAVILVGTQRREATGMMTNASSFYQNIEISFKKEGSAWKIDSAIWQSK
ncbi:MAG: hypothetical protein WCW77_05410 [Patescibacteria group bacterium]|jgi:hypothetical protein